MNKRSKIYVAGHKGMVGSAIVRKLMNSGFSNLLLPDRQELDLINQQNTNEFFELNKPEYVFLAAAKVGGILANNTYRAQFIYENMMIQNNIIHSAYLNDCKKLLFLGSACIYPKESKQPIREDYLLTDILEPTNEPYAIAKISGIKLCENYYYQYGSNFISAMPNNLYGPYDNFDLDTSHVLPALINKTHQAKIKNHENVEIWGTGKPKREFLYVDDLADACIFLMENLNADTLYKNNISHINIGTGEEFSIKDLAINIKKIVGFKGELLFNNKYPDGMYRKLLDCEQIYIMGWKAKTKFIDGLKYTYNWYLSNY